MRREVSSGRWLVLVFLVALAVPCIAAETGPACRKVSAEEALLKTLIAKVEGRITKGGFLELKGEFGPEVTHGIRIYSEPSHTLLILGVDSRYMTSPAGQAWLRSHGTAEARFDSLLPEARPMITLRRPPAGDDRLAVWVHTGGAEESLVGDAKLPSFDAFSFEIRGTLDESGKTRCCSGGPCAQMCVECDGPAFSCCLGTPCCAISCGQEGCVEICGG